MVVGASALEGGTSTGNAVRDTTIRSNVVTDTAALPGAGGGDGIVVVGDAANVVVGGSIAGAELRGNEGVDIVVTGANGFRVVR